MKRRGKIIATLVTLSLSLAMIVIGVYSASLVSFGISGSIAYEIEDVYVNITTKVYSSDIIANNPNAFEASLVQQYKDMLGLSAFASSELDNSVETLANTSISDIDTSKYTLVKSYTYSSLTEEGTNPITDLTLEFNSTDAKTYFIVINIENLSSAPVYAVVQDEKTVPANTVELNNGLQQNILQGEDNRNIVFALGVADFTRPIASGSKFECGIKVGLGDISQTPENLAKLNIAYTDAVSGYTASIKQDAKGVVVVPSTAPVQTRAANDIIAMMPVAQITDPDQMLALLNTGITHVYLPETVVIIAPTAFTANVALTKIEGLDNVVSIGDYAFTACVKLSKIDLPDNCASIGTYAFSNCANLYAIDLPNNLSAISKQMFSDASSLESIDFKNVQTIGENAFYYCTGLTSIDLGNVQGIDKDAFRYCTGLTTIDFKNVQTIGEGAFWACEGLTSVELGGVSEISYTTFANCTGLTSVELGNVDSIGPGAFVNCTGLTGIDLGNVESIGNQAFHSCTGLTSIDLGNVQTIGEYAFYNCAGLTSVDLGNVKSIGDRAFSDCTGLTGELVIPDSVTEIAYSAFYNCAGLTSVDFSNSSASIGEYAFWYCTGLTSIDLGNVASIGSYAFEYTNLTEITIPSSITSVSNISKSLANSKIVQVTNNSSLDITLSDLGIYNVGAEISKTGIFTNTLVKGTKYTTFIVGNYTYIMGFTNPTQETNANDIPNDVTNIYEYAFFGLDNLTSVTIPDSVTSIDYYAFSSCAGLTSIDLGSVTSINSSAFRFCTGLTSITIPKSVTYIANGVFSHCDGITSIVVDESNTKYTSKINGVETNCIIEKGANNTYTLITGCKNSTLPYGITSIGSYAFYGCKGLTSIEIPDSVTSIDYYAFSSCTGLTSIEIPDCVTSIGHHAFSGCTGLTSIEIPDCVTSIGAVAFSNWQQDQSIYFEGTMPENLDAEWNDGCYAKIYLNGVLQN